MPLKLPKINGYFFYRFFKGIAGTLFVAAFTLFFDNIHLPFWMGILCGLFLAKFINEILVFWEDQDYRITCNLTILGATIGLLWVNAFLFLWAAMGNYNGSILFSLQRRTMEFKETTLVVPKAYWLTSTAQEEFKERYQLIDSSHRPIAPPSCRRLQPLQPSHYQLNQLRSTQHSYIDYIDLSCLASFIGLVNMAADAETFTMNKSCSEIATSLQKVMSDYDDPLNIPPESPSSRIQKILRNNMPAAYHREEMERIVGKLAIQIKETNNPYAISFYPEKNSPALILLANLAPQGEGQPHQCYVFKSFSRTINLNTDKAFIKAINWIESDSQIRHSFHNMMTFQLDSRGLDDFIKTYGLPLLKKK